MSRIVAAATTWIVRIGGAEQFYADAKAKESAEAAVVACAAEGVPQDAECFICKSSIEGKGIVSGCACRDGAGLAHVSCLVRQAQVSVSVEIKLVRQLGPGPLGKYGHLTGLRTTASYRPNGKPK